MKEFFHTSRHNVVGYWKHLWKVSAPHNVAVVYLLLGVYKHERQLKSHM